MGMDYRLHVFQIAAEVLNFTKAAKLLHISQPAVTRHISQLEEQYGAQLFVRQKNSITLTSAGFKLLEHAHTVQRLDSQVEQAIRSQTHSIGGTLRIAASLTISECLLPHWLVKARQQYPALRFIITTANTDETIGALLAAKIDLGLIEGNCQRPDIKTELIQKDEIVCVAAPGHSAAKQRSITLVQLKKFPLTVREIGSGTRQVIENTLKDHDIKLDNLNIEFELNNTHAIKKIVQSGHSIAFMPRVTVAEELADGSLVAIKIPNFKITRSFQFIYPSGPKPSGLSKLFMELVKASKSV